MTVWYVPVTPAGTPLIYGGGSRMGKVNAARTEAIAIKHIVEDAAHMPYGNWKNMQKRGYTIERWTMPKRWKP